MRVAPSLKKSELRRQLRAARRSLSRLEHRRRSRAAAKVVMRLPGFAAGKRVAVYLPFDAETATTLLIEAAQRRGVHLFLPVIVDRRRARMRFYAFDGATRRADFGISIPARTRKPMPVSGLDLIVVPLVGVDGAGQRLGMGGGYYDRALAYRRHRSSRPGPFLVGLAFDCQRTTMSFAEGWDLQLDSLATESGLHQFSKRLP